MENHTRDSSRTATRGQHETSVRALNEPARKPILASPSSSSSSLSGLSSPASSALSTPASVNEDCYDLICVGFGPSAIAIAIAIEETVKHAGALRILFIERQTSFAWHGGLLLPSSRMQISFVKDFATLRDPTSKFTFLNYLHCNQRLIDFVNQSTFYPLCEEYNDYMNWCAQQFNHQVVYGEEVFDLYPAEDESGNSKIIDSASPYDGHDIYKKFAVTTRLANDHGEIKQFIRFAKNVVVCAGGRMKFPECFPNSLLIPRIRKVDSTKHEPNYLRVIHSAQFMYSLSQIETIVTGQKSARIAVIGGGQSAAEITGYLHSNYANATIDMIFSSYALKPSDDSPFVNELFNPQAVDEIFAKSQVERNQFIKNHATTNYGVVRIELLEDLFRRMYEEKLPGRNIRLWMRNNRTVSQFEDKGDVILLTLQNNSVASPSNGLEKLEYDFVVAATGYDNSINRDQLLTNLSKFMPTGSPEVERNYQVKTDDRLACKLFTQGSNQSTHGLSDTLLSILAIRGQEIAGSIFGQSL
ncbi:L-lysine 6-monooxygenase (NADPH-requiring)-domain-containing protein [Lipomyces japonicus]|uniref:L-lysine 6-monooxygenase (NADPH-requiring)-domain-containing protein n=1 Tax=Lipomyces japonicus TaxID=56871 RepID=UPI0034CDB6E9